MVLIAMNGPLRFKRPLARAKPSSLPPARLSCRLFASTTARWAMGRPGRWQPRCGPNSTVTPSGLEWMPYRGTRCPQLVLAPPAGVACNGGVRVLFECVRLEHGHSDLAISLAGRGLRARKWNNDNGGRPLTKSPRHFP